MYGAGEVPWEVPKCTRRRQGRGSLGAVKLKGIVGEGSRASWRRCALAAWDRDAWAACACAAESETCEDTGTGTGTGTEHYQ